MSPNLQSVAKVLTNPRDLLRLSNAQLRLQGRAQTPLSVRLRGRARVFGQGRVIFENGVILDGSIVPIEFQTYRSGRIAIGAHTYINYGSSLTAHSDIKIGASCHLGHYTFVMDNNQHDFENHFKLPPSAPVVIEDHVWIGTRVIILPGVRIGARAVIGAGSVVTKDVPPGCVAAGNPARVIRQVS